MSSLEQGMRIAELEGQLLAAQNRASRLANFLEALSITLVDEGEVDDAAEMLKEALGRDEYFVPTHRHLKRGTTYRVLGEARAQCSTRPIVDGEMLVLYRGEDGVASVRVRDEFEDGRFEEIGR